MSARERPQWWSFVVLILLAGLSGCGLVGSPGAESTDGSADDGPVRIMLIGDSLTAGSYYRPQLVNTLYEAGCDVDFVGTIQGDGSGSEADVGLVDNDHQGLGGATTPDVAGQMAGWLTDLGPDSTPDVALVYLGVNDFYNEVSRPETVAGIESIIGDLRQANPSIRVLVAQIMPAVDVQEGVAALNADLAAMARGLDSSLSPVDVVDLSTGFTVDQDLVDGVHPDLEASRRLADLWVKALPSSVTETCGL